MSPYYLTRKQRETLGYLLSVADDASVASVSVRAMCKGIPTSLGIIVKHLDTLEEKGYISRLERGIGTLPSVYKIHREYDDA